MPADFALLYARVTHNTQTSSSRHDEIMRRILSQSITSVKGLNNSARALAFAKDRGYHELSFEKHGEPTEVLKYSSCQNDTLPNAPATPSSPIEIKMLHAPWNPADMNTVQGRYASPYRQSPISPPSCQSSYFPGRSVAGSEGWGIVVSNTSTAIPAGTLVTMGKPGLGTLRSSLWLSDSDVLKVPKDLLDQLGPGGSTLFQLGGTSLRMLTDFVTLQPGDLVIQNAGNSGVGLMTSQLAGGIFSASSVSLVRRGSKSIQQVEDMIEYLTHAGKNAKVILEEELENADYRREIQSELRNLSVSGTLPKLALNAVGGDSARSLLRLLDDGGSLITYGGMAAKPSITVGVSQLIFKDFRILGYWHSRWMVNTLLPLKQAMIDRLVDAVRSKGVICPPCEVFALKDIQDSLKWQANQQMGIRSKLVFDCQQS